MGASNPRLISPLEFIPVAEESGLIVPIGKFVLREALRQARAWHEAGAPRDLLVSVNVSSRQLDSPDLVEAVTAALSDHPVPAGCLHMRSRKAPSCATSRAARTC